MAVEVILPRVDMDMEAGKINRWFAAEGDSVVKGKPLFEIETDKAAMEIEAPADGVLRGVHQIGETLPVGAVVGWICAPDEVFEAPEAVTPAEKAAPVPATAPEAAPVATSSANGDLRATPKARRLAREQGVELASLMGSGPDGRIQAKDVTSSRAPFATTRGLLHGEWLARGAGTPIVFIHGFGADLNSWRPLHGYLGSGRGHYALDLPGHGQSELAGAATLEAFVEAVEATLEAEGVGAAHIVGHSLGGAVAAAFAAYLPAHVRSLTLLAPAGLGPEFNGAFAGGFLAAQREASLAPWVRQLAVDEAALGSAMVKATLALRAKRPLVEAQTKIAAAFFPDGTQAVSTRADLGRYGGPVRVVFGLEDRIIPAAQSRGLPGAVGLHLMANVGHMPHFEARAETAHIVEDNVAAGDRREGLPRSR
jgi:pyruvate dehydrogenase E2 component (dihydrolipoamide acetyltransferase)